MGVCAGRSDELGNKTDVVSVDVGAKGLKTSITIIQHFEPFAKRGRFRLLGDPEIVIDRVVQDPKKTGDLLEIIRRGVAQHSKVAPLWDGWHRP